MKGPWVKLWRNVLNDEKIAFIMRRYGHEAFTFWIGLLTQVEEGILRMDEDIFADLLQLEEMRYQELRGVLLKRGLVVENDEGFLEIPNWEEYQIGESTERVRAYRERRKAPALQKRTCNAGETKTERVEGEGEGEEEGDARAREAVESEEASPETEASPLPEEPEDERPPHFRVAERWYRRFTKATAVLVAPSERDHLKGLELFQRLGEDLARVDHAIEIYFDDWAGFWFARRPKKPPYSPDFSFAGFCSHIDEILSRERSPPKAEAYSTGLAPAERAAAMPTDEERAEVERKLSEASSTAAGRLLGGILGRSA